MPWSLLNLHLILPGFALVLFRIGGLLVTAPVLGSNTIPVRLKVALAFTLAAAIFPMVVHTVPADITLSAAVVGVLGELMVGLVIGTIMTLVVLGVQLAGLLIGQQAGIALASVVDPSAGQQTTVVGQVYMITTVLIFLVIGGHRLMMAALLDTFAVVPVLRFGINESMLTIIADVLTAAYILGIKLFSPVLIALLLTTLAMGFLSRTMPQLNILSIGFAVRSFVAIGAAAVAIGASQDLLVGTLLDGLEAVRLALGLAPLGL